MRPCFGRLCPSRAMSRVGLSCFRLSGIDQATLKRASTLRAKEIGRPLIPLAASGVSKVSGKSFVRAHDLMY